VSSVFSIYMRSARERESEGTGEHGRGARERDIKPTEGHPEGSERYPGDGGSHAPIFD
jgi:hypothetical protein